MVSSFSLYVWHIFWCFSFCSVGVSASAPIWGRIVDLHGPRILFLISFVFLLGGYSGIKHLYDSGPPPGTSTLPALSFYTLVLCSFLTGCGSFAGVTGTLNSTVKSFPDEVVSEWALINYNLIISLIPPLFSASIRNWSGCGRLRTIGFLFYCSRL